MSVVATMSNTNLWNLIRSKYPSFASKTAKATKDMFTERGWEQIKGTDPDILNDFFSLSVRVFLQKIDVSKAVDDLEDAGFGETYNTPYGGIIQRMAVDTIDPISPGYKGNTNGSIKSPFVTRKPNVKERFFNQNFDYQSTITVPSDALYKDAFLQENGMSELVAGIMIGLQNGYTVQKYNNKLEALNAAINSTATPLQETQKMAVAKPVDEATARAFILSMKNLATALKIGPQTDAYNAMKFKSHQDISRVKILVRPGIKTVIDTYLLAGSYHEDKLALPFDIIEVPHFGGLKPQVIPEGETTAVDVYEVYDDLGAVIGFTTTEGGTEVEYTEDSIVYQDPNEDVYAIVADKGVIFSGIQNPYTVQSIYNPRTMQTHYWANCPNNSIKYDALYNMVAIAEPTT